MCTDVPRSTDRGLVRLVPWLAPAPMQVLVEVPAGSAPAIAAARMQRLRHRRHIEDASAVRRPWHLTSRSLVLQPAPDAAAGIHEPRHRDRDRSPTRTPERRRVRRGLSASAKCRAARVLRGAPALFWFDP